MQQQQPQRRRNNNGVMGPTSALTSFLAEKGISAQRIRQQHFDRLAAAEASSAEASSSSAAAAAPVADEQQSVAENGDAPLGRDLYAFPTVSNRPANLQVNRPRLRFEYVDEPVLDDEPTTRNGTKTGKQNGSKKQDKGKGKSKGKGKKPSDSDSSSDEEGEANRWIAGFRMVRRRVAFCGQVIIINNNNNNNNNTYFKIFIQCDERLPDGILRCSTCSKKESEARKATVISPSSKKRRAKGSDGSILNEIQGRVLSLQDICIRYVCDNIDDVESFGDIDDRARDRICELVCHVRRLTNDTVKLFLDPTSDSLRLYDCARMCPCYFSFLFL